MTSKDKDFSAQYRPTVCLARLRGHVLQLLKSETQKVISSGSLCDFTAKPRREMLEHIIDITRDPPVSQELLVRSHFPRLTLCTHSASRTCAGRGSLRFKADVVCTAAHVQVSVRFVRGKWLPGNEGEFVCAALLSRVFIFMQAIVCVEIAFACMENDEYGAAQEQLRLALKALDWKSKTPLDQQSYLVAEVLMHLGFTLDSLEQHEQAYTHLQKSRVILEANASKAAAGGDKQLEIFLRSHIASVLNNLSVWHLNASKRFRDGKDAASRQQFGEFLRKAKLTQEDCVSYRKELGQDDTVNMAQALYRAPPPTTKPYLRIDNCSCAGTCLCSSYASSRFASAVSLCLATT